MSKNTGRDFEVWQPKLVHLPQVCDMFVEIFKNDLFYKRSMREDGKFERALYLFFEYMSKISFACNQVFIAGDYCGGAMFFSAGAKYPGLLEHICLLPTAIRIYSLRKMFRSLTILNDMEKEIPKFPHCYLFEVGVKPEFQHKGIATALVLPTLNECDRLKMPCYAEFTSAQSAAWGEKLGFKVFKEKKIYFYEDVIVRLSLRAPQ